MGVLLNEVCCIDESNLGESFYENTQYTQPDTNNKNDQYKALRKRSINQFKNASQDSFPLNEIGSSFNINDKPITDTAIIADCFLIVSLKFILITLLFILMITQKKDKIKIKINKFTKISNKCKKEFNFT